MSSQEEEVENSQQKHSFVEHSVKIAEIYTQIFFAKISWNQRIHYQITL